MTAATVRVAFVGHKAAPVHAAAVKPWPELADLLTRHEVGAKDGAAWMPAAIEPGPRKAERVRAVTALSLDVEAKCEGTGPAKRVIGPFPPELPDLAAELRARGWAAALATSHSHREPLATGGDLGPRYRVTLPLSRELKPAELRPLALHVARLLGLAECFDSGCAEPARLLFLPRHPPERAELAEREVLDGEPLPVDSLLGQAVLSEAVRAAKALPPEAGVIDSFNSQADIPALLERHGYKPAGGHRWLWPGSSTGVPGVVFVPDKGRVFSGHTADPLHRPTEAHDAFGAWCILEHGGDERAAVRAAARLLGMERTSQPAAPRARGDGKPAHPELQPLPLAQAVQRAEALLRPELQATGEAYPVEALGPLADAALALAEGAQVAPAMAGQSLLAAAALLVQGVANVRSLDGDTKPLSLFALSVAASGDGKDSADRVALRSVHEHQREAARAYAEMKAEHERADAARKKNDPPPEPLPPAPYRTAADVTVEGLRRSFVEGIASQGAFSTEAGAVLAGHAMAPEQRTKTAATLCRLLDRGHLSVVRGGAARVELYGLRLSAHLLVQPAALGDVLTDEGLANIGFWPRFLLAWPAPLAPRVFRPWRADDAAPIRAYWSRCDALLGRPVPGDCDGLSAIELQADALQGMAAFFEGMEREGRRGELRDVRPFALRATELACRVAGVLAAFAGRASIDAEAARNGCALVAHSLENWQEALAGKADPVPGWALTLYRWLAERPEGVALRDIPRIGPAAVRPAARRDAAVERLRALGLLDDAEGRAVARGVDHAGG